MPGVISRPNQVALPIISQELGRRGYYFFFYILIKFTITITKLQDDATGSMEIHSNPAALQLTLNTLNIYMINITINTDT